VPANGKEKPLGAVTNPGVESRQPVGADWAGVAGSTRFSALRFRPCATFLRFPVEESPGERFARFYPVPSGHHAPTVHLTYGQQL
jgi:hypothetical protein